MMKIAVKNLVKTFVQADRTITALNGISFEVDKAEIIALVGSSGSGKSTLFHLLAGIQSPTSGEIWLNDLAVHNFNDEQRTHLRKKHLGIVFQNHLLVPHLTALENIMLPLQIAGESFSKCTTMAQELIDKVGLTERQHHLPHQLSGGESQRIAIARALIKKPQLILADEPTGQLDYDTTQSIMQLMLSLFKEYQCTAMIITHDQDIAQRCHRSLTLKNGQFRA